MVKGLLHGCLCGYITSDSCPCINEVRTLTACKRNIRTLMLFTLFHSANVIPCWPCISSWFIPLHLKSCFSEKQRHCRHPQYFFCNCADPHLSVWWTLPIQTGGVFVCLRYSPPNPIIVSEKLLVKVSWSLFVQLPLRPLTVISSPVLPPAFIASRLPWPLRSIILQMDSCGWP